MGRAHAWLWLTALAFGCGRGPFGSSAACCAAPDVASAQHAASAATKEPVDAEPAVPAGQPWPDAIRYHREEGCARAFTPSGDFVQDLASVGRLCAAGLFPIEGETKTLPATPGRIVEIPFTLPAANSCFRAAAVASRGSVAMAIYRGDRVLVSATSVEPLVLTPPAGPLCVREAGSYRAAVVATAAHAPDASPEAVLVSLRIWQATQN